MPAWALAKSSARKLPTERGYQQSRRQRQLRDEHPKPAPRGAQQLELVALQELRKSRPPRGAGGREEQDGQVELSRHAAGRPARPARAGSCRARRRNRRRRCPGVPRECRAPPRSSARGGHRAAPRPRAEMASASQVEKRPSGDSASSSADRAPDDGQRWRQIDQRAGLELGDVDGQHGRLAHRRRGAGRCARCARGGSGTKSETSAHAHARELLDHVTCGQADGWSPRPWGSTFCTRNGPLPSTPSDTPR